MEEKIIEIGNRKETYLFFDNLREAKQNGYIIKPACDKRVTNATLIVIRKRNGKRRLFFRDLVKVSN